MRALTQGDRSVVFLWFRDINAPAKSGFHPVNGDGKEIYITEEELRLISSLEGEVALTVYTLPEAEDGTIIYRILSIQGEHIDPAV
jgi:hypothetical protein